MNSNNTNNIVLSTLEQSLNDNDNQNNLPKCYKIMNVLMDFYSVPEILNTFHTNELVNFIEDEHYWSIEDYISNVKSEAVDEYLMFHPEYTKEDFLKEIKDYNKIDFRNFLCDLTGNGYYVDGEKLLDDIKKMIL